FADKAVRVGENFASGSGVERATFGVLDARIEVECGFFGAARVLDALGSGQRVDIFVEKVEIAGELAELVGLGDAAERIFGGDLRKLERGLEHAVEACA